MYSEKGWPFSRCYRMDRFTNISLHTANVETKIYELGHLSGSLWTGFRESKCIIDFYVSSIPWRVGRVPLIILSYLLVFTHSVTKGHLFGNKPKVVSGNWEGKTCLLPVFKTSKTCLKHLSFSLSQSDSWYVHACFFSKGISVILKYCK